MNVQAKGSDVGYSFIDDLGDYDNIHIVIVILKINKDDAIPDLRWY